MEIFHVVHLLSFQNEAAAALLAATTTPKNLHLAEENDGEDEMVNGNGSNDLSRDLEIDDTIKDPVEDRLTLAERNERLHDQLKVGTIGSLFGNVVANAIRASGGDPQARRRLGRLGTFIGAAMGTRQETTVYPSKTGQVIENSRIRYAARVCVLSSSPSGGGSSCNLRTATAAATAFKCKLARFVVRIFDDTLSCAVVVCLFFPPSTNA